MHSCQLLRKNRNCYEFPTLFPKIRRLLLLLRIWPNFNIDFKISPKPATYDKKPAESHRNMYKIKTCNPRTYNCQLVAKLGWYYAPLYAVHILAASATLPPPCPATDLTCARSNCIVCGTPHSNEGGIPFDGIPFRIENACEIPHSNEGGRPFA